MAVVWIRLVKLNGAREIRELSANLGNQVSDLKRGFRMQSADGQRFVVDVVESAQPITILVNWTVPADVTAERVTSK